MRFLRSCVVLVLAVVTVFAGGQVVSATSSPTFSWKVSALTPSSQFGILDLVNSNGNSSVVGARAWSVSGAGCYRQGTKIVTRGSGSCRVAVTVRATSTYRSIAQAKWFRVVPSCAMGGSCVLGDPGPGGGIVFYVGSFIASGTTCDTECTYLEAAPSGWSAGATSACIYPGDTVTDPRCAWSGNVSDSVSTYAEAIGTGYQNTIEMIAQSGGGDTAARAATASQAYRGGSKSDWYLPALLELNELRINRAIVGGLVDNVYWSSSESFNSFSWGRDFAREPNFCDSNIAKYKADHWYVRPIRAFRSLDSLEISAANPKFLLRIQVC